MLAPDPGIENCQYRNPGSEKIKIKGFATNKDISTKNDLWDNFK